ncbi:hypothetical protein L1S35_10560 [Flavobacterium sp. AS60]|uniref:hypothetical protein n=1 Tax=Flavobacterium anseongense TaxID=2910677 RepID=UPI001F311A0D|nr:hypothetical protein [Flavobacterium sp. AS60]MCF6130118.1 hypothetical protein [Flavobacterium sp. AS60]
MGTKQTLVVSILLLFSFVGLAQDVDKTISVDFKNLKNKYEETVDRKKTFQIKITNINRNLYKVDGIKVETNYNIAVPSALTGIKLPAYIYTTPPSQDKLKSTGVGLSARSSDIYDEIQKRFYNIEANAKKLDDITLLFNKLSHLSKDCQNTFNDIKVQVLKKSNQYLNGNDNYGTTTVEQMRSNLEAKMTSLTEEAERELSDLPNWIARYEEQTPNELEARNMSNIKELTSEKNKQISSTTTIENLSNQIANFKEIKADFKDLLKEIKANLEKAKASVNDMKKFEKEDKPYELLHLYDVLTSPATFEYDSEVITAKTDEIKYTITIEPTELNICNANGKKVIEVIVKVNGGFKIDFSSGAFLNSGSDDFLGNSYYYIKTDADHRKIVTADRGSRYLMSVGALMHFYWRTTSPVKLGGSIGVSTTAAVSDLLFHIGPSIFIGHKNRVVISGGLTLKSSPILDQKLKTDVIYTNLETPDAVPTVNVFPKAGLFFSLTYNFTASSNK